MSWEFTPSFDAAFRAALKSGKSLIYVCQPTWWTVKPMLESLHPESQPGTRNLILVPDAIGLLESAAFLESVEYFRPLHAATGLTRTGRVLSSAEIATLISTPTNVLRLLSRSAIDLGAVSRVVLAWPELHADYPELEAIETIMSESRTSQRVVITSDTSTNSDFLERHARRAPTANAAPPYTVPSGSARYAATEFSRASDSVIAALDILNPAKALIWDPSPTPLCVNSWMPEPRGTVISSNPDETTCDLAIAMQLPTQEVFETLQENSRNVLLLVRAFQIPYVRAMVATARSLRLPSEADRARDRAFRLRQEIRGYIERQPLNDSMLALSPLFDEHDPSTVAAALASQISLTEEPECHTEEVPTWIRIRVDAGKRQRIRTGDLVGALLNAVEIPKNRVGKVDVRDGYSLVEVRADVADEAVNGLNGLLLRGNKLAARPDRR